MIELALFVLLSAGIELHNSFNDCVVYIKADHKKVYLIKKEKHHD
jgi:hypothetical protein